MSEDRAPVTDTREKRDIIGELPWQVRSSVVVLLGLVLLYLALTNQVPPRNWFEKFFVYPCVGILFIYHCYWLIEWGFERALARFRDKCSTPELD